MHEPRTVLITGASRGIGRATALAFAKEEANLVINYAGNQAMAEEVARACEAEGCATLLVQGDVSKREDCERIVREAIQRFKKIDVLVNNAGITKDQLLLMMSAEEFDQVIDTNLRGTFCMMKEVLRPMLRNRSGRIINLASVVGVMGNAGQLNYAASKAGVIGMTKSLAREVARKGITVNAVAPGYIETDMTGSMHDEAKKQMDARIPMGRGGSPKEVAAAIRFLASEEAGYITGQVLCVDGGMCM